jgi:hypothetical protein
MESHVDSFLRAMQLVTNGQYKVGCSTVGIDVVYSVMPLRKIWYRW